MWDKAFFISYDNLLKMELQFKNDVKIPVCLKMWVPPFSSIFLVLSFVQDESDKKV